MLFSVETLHDEQLYLDIHIKHANSAKSFALVQELAPQTQVAMLR